MMMTNMTMYSMFGCLVDGCSHQATALHLTTLNIPPTLMEQPDAYLMMMMTVLIVMMMQMLGSEVKNSEVGAGKGLKYPFSNICLT